LSSSADVSSRPCRDSPQPEAIRVHDREAEVAKRRIVTPATGGNGDAAARVETVVAVTVPHKCMSAEKNALSRINMAPCDAHALGIGQTLHQILANMSQSLPSMRVTELLVPSVSREVVDANRAAGAGLAMRQRLRQLTSTARAHGARMVVVDVHTFSEKETGTTYDEWRDYDIVLLTPQAGMHQLAVPLIDTLRNANLRVLVAQGATNDIMNEATESGAVAQLIEFRQDLAGTQKMKAALTAIGKWVESIATPTRSRTNGTADVSDMQVWIEWLGTHLNGGKRLAFEGKPYMKPAGGGFAVPLSLPRGIVPTQWSTGDVRGRTETVTVLYDPETNEIMIDREAGKSTASWNKRELPPSPDDGVVASVAGFMDDTFVIISIVSREAHGSPTWTQMTMTKPEIAWIVICEMMAYIDQHSSVQGEMSMRFATVTNTINHLAATIMPIDNPAAIAAAANPAIMAVRTAWRNTDKSRPMLRAYLWAKFMWLLLALTNKSNQSPAMHATCKQLIVTLVTDITA
jgi:hypothetical protein